MGALFGNEPEEPSHSHSSSSESEPDKSSVFNLGWQQLNMAGKANFARNAAEEGKLPRKKRPYDNQKRAAQAAYTRKSGQFKENGTSQKRVLDVVSRDICLCNWVWIYLFLFFAATNYFVLSSCNYMNTISKSWPTSWTPPGARQKCFCQYQVKELHAFLGEFWSLRKQDQDSLDSLIN